MAVGVFCLAALLAVATAQSRSYLSLETQVPKGWVVSGVPAASEKVPFMVAMKQENLGQLNALFEAVTDPSNLQYGEYLTNTQVRNMVATKPAKAAAVIAALAPAECVNLGDALRCSASAAQIETIFETRLRLVKHSSSGLALIRQIGNFSIPAHIAADVEVGVVLCVLYSFGVASSPQALTRVESGNGDDEYMGTCIEKGDHGLPGVSSPGHSPDTVCVATEPVRQPLSAQEDDQGHRRPALRRA
jgi:subtilase family serine protease